MLPHELTALLSADASTRDAAWQNFVAAYSRLLLDTARSVHSDYDAAMDAYSYLLEQLAQKEFRRLRAYNPDTGSRFAAWLVVVARRICVDRLREKYGRAGEPQSLRRRLADLLGSELDPDTTADPSLKNPESELRKRQLADALATAFSRLAPSDQLLLTLRFEDELSAREIGQILRLPTPFHVYRRLNAVLADLKTALERGGIYGVEP
ncbi:MAG TPA: sigma-70 family RNA polymerase sigma factor [Gemmatimonadales bacterium]